MLRLTVLGPVRGWRDDESEIALRPPQARSLLAVLLARVGRPVSMTDMLDVLWGPSPPDAATNAVHVHVRTLRRLLEPGQWLLRGSGGYQIDGSAGRVDLVEFRRLVDQARTAKDGVASYRSALRLWTGPIAGNVDAAVRSHALFRELERECLRAACDAADAALSAGQATAMLDALHTIAERDLLDEAVQARLIRLLAAAGRQAQALERFGLIRRTLAEELGVEPGGELTAAHREVLRPATVVPLAPAPPPAAAVRPAQLPAGLPSFTGRTAELTAAAAVRPDGSAAWPLVTVVGMAGVGKTALAVHLAHEVAARYPDGQLFADLRGFDPGGAAADPADALRGFLQAFGITAGEVPRTLDGMVALYRSLLADRRVLVVVDNARDAEQVRPLLPGSRGCLTVVTSRTMLPGLIVTNAAHPVPLRPLSDEESRDLLAQRVGPERVAAEPEAAAAIVRRCGGLPLALAVVAARMVTDPGAGLREAVAELDAAQGGLDAFSALEAVTDVRAVFSWSYHALGGDAARLLRLLGGARIGPDIGLAAAASLAGVPVRDVRPLLAGLVQANLVSRSGPDRYTLHDLIAAFAAELAAAEAPAATRRLLEHYRLAALAAERLDLPTRTPLEPDRPLPPDGGPADATAARAWLTAERATLLAAVRAAAALGLFTHAWQMMWSALPFLHRSGHWDDMLAGLRVVLAAADTGRDPGAVAAIHTQLGLITTELRQYGEAEEHLGRAGALFGDLADRRGQGQTSRRLAYLYVQQDRLAEALKHAVDALAHDTAAGFTYGVASSLNDAAWIHVLDGDPGLAVDKGRRALALFEESGNETGAASAWDTLGHAHHKLGDFPQAHRCYLASLELRRRSGSRVYEADVLHRLGDNHHAAGELAEARDHWRQALAILVALGGPDVEKLRRKLAANDPGHPDHVTVHRR
ncbi:AfsR/SARP family transcriptional regulator [Actinoplanes sp. CA-054009]